MTAAGKVGGLGVKSVRVPCPTCKNLVASSYVRTHMKNMHPDLVAMETDPMVPVVDGVAPVASLASSAAATDTRKKRKGSSTSGIQVAGSHAGALDAAVSVTAPVRVPGSTSESGKRRKLKAIASAARASVTI